MSRQLMLPRVQRGSDERFVPGERTAVVSLPWWDGERREVVFVDLGNGWERTIVVRWPTLDAEGLHLNIKAIRAGEGVTLMPWDVRPATREKIDRIVAVWRPDRHDLYVDGEPEAPSLGPTLQGLLDLDLGLDLERRLSLATDRWCAIAVVGDRCTRKFAS